MKDELGEDFVDFLGYNPLLHSIEVQFAARYADQENIAGLEQSLAVVPIVKEVYYQKSLVDVVNRNLKTITIIIVGFSIILCIISVVLVNTTIRLSIFARRLLIKSMQLVGATRNFIRKPFLIKGILNGLAGGLIAGTLLAGMFYFAHREIPTLFPLEDMKMIATVIGFVIMIGILISGMSTWLSLNKYLRRNRDELY
jgi:cell division transport system permease protein